MATTSKLFSNVEITHARFRDGFTRFADLVARPGRGRYSVHERPPWKLVVEPFAEYTGPNLKYAGSREEALQNAPYSIIRCFNVTMYLDKKTRTELLRWFSEIVDDDSLVFVGRDGIASAEATFTVYQRKAGELKATEFCFSIDCLRPIGIMPWYCFNDDDPETLAIVAASQVLRKDKTFCRLLDDEFDAAWEEWGLYSRGPDGELVPPGNHEAWWPAWFAAIEPLVEFIGNTTLVDAAVDVFQSIGINAWRNSIGYVSVEIGALLDRPGT